MNHIIGELFLRGINNKYWDGTFFILSARIGSLPAVESTKKVINLFYIEMHLTKKHARTLLEMMKRRRVWNEAADL